MTTPPKPPRLPAILGPLNRYLDQLYEYLRGLRITSVTNGEVIRSPSGTQIVANPKARAQQGKLTPTWL
jgi:hypothetical protein